MSQITKFFLKARLKPQKRELTCAAKLAYSRGFKCLTDKVQPTVRYQMLYLRQQVEIRILVMNKLDKENIRDILALTPIQEGMFFHYLKDPGSDYYFEQLCLEISGKINGQVFEKN